jgi:hypothetical protein
MGALENKELVQTIRELLLDGHSPDDILFVASQIFIQLEKITTGGND